MQLPSFGTCDRLPTSVREKSAWTGKSSHVPEEDRRRVARADHRWLASEIPRESEFPSRERGRGPQLGLTPGCGAGCPSP
eukprot:7164509-Heterocapsa_arctica.AAC.1